MKLFISASKYFLLYKHQPTKWFDFNQLNHFPTTTAETKSLTHSLSMSSTYQYHFKSIFLKRQREKQFSEWKVKKSVLRLTCTKLNIRFVLHYKSWESFSNPFDYHITNIIQSRVKWMRENKIQQTSKNMTISMHSAIIIIIIINIKWKCLSTKILSPRWLTFFRIIMIQQATI